MASRDPVALVTELHAGKGSVAVTLQTEKGARRCFTLQEGVHLHVPPSLHAIVGPAALENGVKH